VLDAGGRVGVVLVERLVLQQRGRERVELPRFSCSATTSLCEVSTIRRTSPSTSFCVSCETSAAPGRNGPEPSCGSTATGLIAELIPAADHLAGDLGQLLDVGLGARARLAEDDLLGGSAPERDLIFAVTSGSLC
jgi:hypothetical protein